MSNPNPNPDAPRVLKINLKVNAAEKAQLVAEMAEANSRTLNSYIRARLGLAHAPRGGSKPKVKKAGG